MCVYKYIMEGTIGKESFIFLFLKKGKEKGLRPWL